MEPIQLDPMAVIQAQREKINALTDENVRLTAAVHMLQQELARDHATEKGSGDPTTELHDVTDEVVGAEITS